MASGETLSSVTGPYFTKYRDDHWDAPPDTAQSAVMFKDKEYPSASAALEAYIQQHEGRPGSFLPPGRQPVEPVEDLLTPHLGSSRAGFADQVQVQRLQVLKKMVDEAYQRLEMQSLGRGVGGSAPHTAPGQNVSAAANQTLTESQRVLTCISPLPGVTPCVSEATVSTDALLNARPQFYPAPAGAAQSSSNRRSRGYKTMQDYVEEARRAVVVDPAGVLQSPPIGSTARPTVLSVPPSSRQYSNGGRSPPGWVKDLNGSVQTNPSPVGKAYPKSSSQKTIVEEQGRAGSGLNHKDSCSRSKDDMYLLAEARVEQGSRVAASSHLDKFSLTTDDLVYATPDGRSLSAMKYKSADLSSPGRSYNSRLQRPGNHPRTQEAAQPTPANNMLSTMRRDFADKLLQEVEEGPSSIVTGHLGDGGAMHAYLSPILPSSRGPAPAPPHQPSPAYSPTKLRTLGLLTPETERLLSNPPRPGAMPGYVPSPVMPYLSSSEGATTPSPASDQGVLPTESHHHHVDPRDLSTDFTERVRALLLAPPGGEEQSCSPGGVSEGQRTEDILDGDREWERQPSYKPPKYVSEELSYGARLNFSKEKGPNIVDSFLKDCLDETDKEKAPPTLSGPHQQPGSMEALKNMLFKVQSMVPPPGDQSVNDPDTTDTQQPPGDGLENDECPDQQYKEIVTIREQEAEEQPTQERQMTTSQKSLAAYKHLVSESASFEEQPGTESLQKAMEHLSRLKTLVKETK